MQRLLGILMAIAAIAMAGPAFGQLQINMVEADDTTITIHSEGTPAGPVALREFPLIPLDQDWRPLGRGLQQSFQPGFMRLQITQPSFPLTLNPYLINRRHIDAAATPHFAMRIRVTGGPATIPMALYHRAWNGTTNTVVPFTITPTGDWQIVRLNLAGSTNWEGFRRLRIDFAEGESSAAPYDGANIDIEWIAITEFPNLQGFSPRPSAALWRFDHVRFTGAAGGQPFVQIPRFADGRDRAYSQFQWVSVATNQPASNRRHATDFDDMSRIGDDRSLGGWAPTGNGQRASVENGQLVIRYFQPPAGVAFDPYIETGRLVDADEARYLRFRAQFVGAPASFQAAVYNFASDFSGVANIATTITNTGQPQITTIDLSNMGSAWSGERYIRLDLPELAGSAAWTSATVRIDWLALTNDLDFDGSDPDSAYRFWSFGADRNFEFNRGSSIKGLQVQMIDDAIELGVQHAGQNVLMGSLVDLSGAPPKWTWDVDGVAIPLNPQGFINLDRQLSRLSDSGAEVALIVLNAVPDSPQPLNPLINPLTDLERHPNRFSSSYNLTDEVGYRYTRAIMEALAARYGRADSAAGQVTRYVVGNEINSHWWWYNLGEVNEDIVIAQYSDAMRVTDIAVRSTHADLAAWVSMEHHWNSRFGNNSSRAMFGKVFFDKFAQFQRERGDYPWAVAHHPYPENLFNADFWNDTSATFDFNTPRITYKNTEVLPAYMGQEQFRFRGRLRGLAFTEQGFHSPSNPAGWELQAAAYAYSWVRLSNQPELEAYILHRHVDFEGEGGLNLGLWTNDPDQFPTPSAPLDKKPSWFVFQAADGPDWEEAFAPFLARTGLPSWEAGLPKRTGIHFTFDDGAEGWIPQNQIAGFQAGGGSLVFSGTGDDPFLVREEMFIGPDSVQELAIRLSATAGENAQFFWGTQQANAFAEARSIRFPIVGDGQMRTYMIDLGAHPEWDGRIIRRIRLDPTENAGPADLEIEFILGGRYGELDLPGIAPAAWILLGD